jgi:hypothetical protein
MPRSGEEIERALREFVKKWDSFGGTEKSASPTFLNQLFECSLSLHSQLPVDWHARTCRATPTGVSLRRGRAAQSGSPVTR